MKAPIAATLAVLLLAGCASSKEEQAIESMREAMIAAQQKDNAAAKAAAERASEIRPGFVDPHMLLANLAEQEGDFETARRHYIEVLKLDPTDTAAGVAIGFTYLCEARFDEAKDWFLKAIEADPGYEAAAYNLGSLLEHRGEPDTAAAWFDIAATLDARDPRALAHIAGIRLGQRRFEDALAAADAALRRAPNYPQARAARTAALQALGRN
jgi:tetratricopeptide (TPR) repeat protein